MHSALSALESKSIKVVKTIKHTSLLDLNDRPLDQDQQPILRQEPVLTVAIVSDQSIRAQCTEKELLEFENMQNPQIGLHLTPIHDSSIVNQILKTISLNSLQPTNLNKVLNSVTRQDYIKVREILKQYKALESYRLRRYWRPFSWMKNLIAKWTASFKEEDQPSEVLKTSCIVKAYAHHQSGKMIAILAKNECIYFLNLQSKQLVGSTLFNKRHYKSTTVKFAPGQSNLLVICGQSGLVVWNLLNMPHFIQTPMSDNSQHQQNYRKQYSMWYAKEGNYSFLTFSSSGKYLAAIRREELDPNNCVIEVLDLCSMEENPSSFTVKRGLSSPSYLAFSPLQNYLLIGYRPEKNYTKVRVLDLNKLYSDSWYFDQLERTEEIASTIWSQDEAFILVQLKHVNLVYLLTLKCSKLLATVQEEEIQELQNKQTLKGQLINLLNSFSSKRYSLKALVYNMECDPKYLLSNMVTTSHQSRIIASYDSQQMVKGLPVQRLLAIYSLKFMTDYQCADISLIRRIDTFQGSLPIFLQVRPTLHLEDSSQRKKQLMDSQKLDTLSYIDSNRDSLHFVIISS